MARTPLVLLVLVSLSALTACREEETVGLDTDGDGVVDPVPADRGGPWFDCFAALDGGTQGDVCAFDGYCGGSEARRSREIQAGCVDNRLYLAQYVLRGPQPCESPELSVDGACVNYPDLECSQNEPGELGTMCVGYEELPPSDGVPAAPWPHHELEDCALLQPAGAENGDPCEGDFICDMLWRGESVDFPEQGRADRMISWCDAGTLRIVFAVPTY